MPKKFATENPKAAASRERKKNAKDAEIAKKQKAAEDAAWKDEDKQVLKKLQRKEELEKKKQQQLERKAEAKALLEKEMISIKPNKPQPSAKVTRAQIGQIKTVSNKKEEGKVETHLETPLTENINRLTVDGEEARSVTEAIAVLSSELKDIDLHPEKRMKAAYNAFEERRLSELKIEHPSLRLSQLKQMIFKEWQKSPENPLNSNN
ncbi:coiled-coil domain-containing protein 124 [Coccinella septempunctata]|uniref:coiled-coil domain-containing protein 124 n=1 Tax=Coccinella septempunctata TaxID=41139 RepID=UPI001D0791E8|nr:coiled-coil domain-containing protein 124 [Coccinella septempunctata]XP_044766003.1 coiled-coil domain-containing protein 124 [Coccinella septempunctata]